MQKCLISSLNTPIKRAYGVLFSTSRCAGNATLLVAILLFAQAFIRGLGTMCDNRLVGRDDFTSTIQDPPSMIS